MGQDFGNRYIKAINEVSREDILTAARQYILPEQYVMVAVGAGLAPEPGKDTGSAIKDPAPHKSD
jgi:predicted Zn-dependent peptidase